MATNPPKGDGHRNGAVRQRSQTQIPAGAGVLIHLATDSVTPRSIPLFGKL